MQVAQIYDIVNPLVAEATGKEDLLQKDLSNLVDVGTTTLETLGTDNYVHKIINKVGKTVVVARTYKGSAPSVYMDSWEFGSVLEKIKGELPVAVENDSWELEDKKSYDPNVFHQPKVSVKFFNSKTTFEVDASFTELQVKESFHSAEKMNAFLSMIQTNIDNALTIKYDSLIRSTINSMIADTVHDEFEGVPTAEQTGVKAVNLLKLYKDETGDETILTKEQAIKSPEFIRFAVFMMDLYQSRLSTASTLFNIGKNVRFTSSDYLNVVLLAEFKSAANVYLQSDTYNEQFTELPNAETVPFWQASGKDFGFTSTSKINVVSGSGNAIEMDGILGVMFDKEALGVTNMDRRVHSHFNPKGEFYTNFYKADASYFNDADENFVVFYIG